MVKSAKLDTGKESEVQSGETRKCEGALDEANEIQSP